MSFSILIFCVVLFISFLCSPKKQAETEVRLRKKGGGLPWLGGNKRRRRDKYDPGIFALSKKDKKWIDTDRWEPTDWGK